MAKKIIYISGIVLTIVIGTFLYYKYCCEACRDASQPGSVIPAASSEMVADRAFSIDYDGFKYRCSENFRFNKDGFNALLPVGDSVDTGIITLMEFLRVNGDLELQIKGCGMKEEKNLSDLENLGMARAGDVKSYLVSKGMDPERIKIEGEISDLLSIDDNIVSGAIQLKIAATDDFVKFRSGYNANAITVLFNSNESETGLSAGNLEKIAGLVASLRKYNEPEIIISGHTDNIGTNAANMILGEDRANYLKAVMIENGYPAEKINTISKGEEEPAADNNTSQGRSQNRRAIINIK